MHALDCAVARLGTNRAATQATRASEVLWLVDGDCDANQRDDGGDNNDGSDGDDDHRGKRDDGDDD